MSHFKIYGSTAFVRIPEECRTSKLYAKAVKGVLVGYTDMGYRVLVENKIIISRHVRFIENDAQTIKLDMGKNEDCEKDSTEINNREKEYEEIYMQNEEKEVIKVNNDQEENRKESQEVERRELPKRTRKQPNRYNDSTYMPIIAM